ncbi:MAG: flagellar type III secretion system pore protein FliP [Pirellulales bacterium]|nr:flagellar type III secretion system pore protein FliP [Pirellulales bacterium]
MLAWLTVLTAVLTLLSPATAQNSSNGAAAPAALNFSNAPTTATASGANAANMPLNLEVPEGLAGGPKQWTSPAGLSSTIQVMLLLTVLSLAPAILLMTTCFVRIVVVLGLLRQAIGTQQLPPSQVITSLSLFISILIMTPVWKEVYDGAIKPYSNNEITIDQAWDSGVQPIREFMIMQIERTDNSDDVRLFLEYLPEPPDPDATDFGYKDVPIQVLLPAFMLSELKTAFLIGFQIYLPFLILDMVIAAVLVSMGMMMLPPVLISLPFKLLLFVLLDGWHLIVGMLLESFEVFL